MSLISPLNCRYHLFVLPGVSTYPWDNLASLLRPHTHFARSRPGERAWVWGSREYRQFD